MSRKQPKRKAGKMAYVAIAGFFILAIVGGVGFGVASAASADSVDDVARVGSFGFSKSAHDATVSSGDVKTAITQEERVSSGEPSPAFYERSALASSAPRDVSAGMIMIDDMERAARERRVAEDAAAVQHMVDGKAMQGVFATVEEAKSGPPEPGAMEYGLPAVDWSVDRETFMAEWTARIDDYLDGSPLAGYGAVFAEAAWVNGVDPRWSPAISNTESSKGTVCFLPYNAWGWGSVGWNDWETAIRTHVAGLADGYGYSITLTAAQVYCPPNWSNWYNNTISEMALI